MRKLALYLSMFALISAPVASHAANFVLFTVTTSDGAWKVTLPQTPTVDSPSTYSSSAGFPADAFDISGLTVTSPQNITLSNQTVEFYDVNAGGGFEDLTGFMGTTDDTGFNFGGGTLAVTTAQFTGPITDPTFALGTGTVFGYTSTNVLSYAITPAPALTPEPSSLLLLGTGALGIAGSLRRRIFS